jgi:hypothetical protein
MVQLNFTLFIYTKFHNFELIHYNCAKYLDIHIIRVNHAEIIDFGLSNFINFFYNVRFI